MTITQVSSWCPKKRTAQMISQTGAICHALANRSSEASTCVRKSQRSTSISKTIKPTAIRQPVFARLKAQARPVPGPVINVVTAATAGIIQPCPAAANSRPKKRQTSARYRQDRSNRSSRHNRHPEFSQCHTDRHRGARDHNWGISSLP